METNIDAYLFPVPSVPVGIKCRINKKTARHKNGFSRRGIRVLCVRDSQQVNTIEAREMPNLIFGLLACFLITFIVVKSARLGGGIGLDNQLDGVQKMHATAVPRVGGIAVALAVALTLALGALLGSNPRVEVFKLLLCALPVFLGGIIEDFTKQVSPAARLLCAIASAAIGDFALGAVVDRVDLPLIDSLLVYSPIALGLTLLMVSGLTNAFNLIDGFNGLAGGVAVLMLASIGFVAHQVDDWLILSVSLTMIGAILGFLVWNFPFAAIFLGDGGAYFIGFTIAELVVLLIARHPNVSAWYAVVVTIYPIFETIFTIYRRRIVRGCAAGEPDGIHLHTLIFRRVVRRAGHPETTRQRTRRNARTSPYLWTISLISIVPATFLWNNEVALFATAMTFIAIYVWLYASIVKFRAPRWLVTYMPRDSLPAPSETPANHPAEQPSQAE
ncbi:MraY family glycosyltransferase [Paraburkholderia atlantica]|uniref:MraY family glycosyltransferase n=1 Tax=Paraburkholderia atlantica TaxID=2654982 RepID=UPI001853A9F0|nr:glycosyltransferase [Paraburkholderia atlantica]MBB5505173.1 UDP-N-acetylmuramyl pentapeptide phosphotransferase/UDP-N-acetylglucosamine-1-phosphate transferase [Paraburkholderia atlantica]